MMMQKDDDAKPEHLSQHSVLNGAKNCIRIRQPNCKKLTSTNTQAL